MSSPVEQVAQCPEAYSPGSPPTITQTGYGRTGGGEVQRISSPARQSLFVDMVRCGLTRDIWFQGEGPGGAAPFTPSSACRPASSPPLTFRSVQPVPRAGALTPVPRWSARARDAGGNGSRKEMGKDMAKANATTATSAATSMSASPIASNSSRRAPGQRVRFTRPATPSQRHRLSRHCAIGSRYRSVSSVYCMAYSSASVSS